MSALMSKSHNLLILCLALTVSPPAAAYLDPGTGSMIIQGIVAAFAVAGLTIKNYWYQIRAFFGKEAPGSILDDEEQNPGEGN